jgi:hypothetical protein
MTVSEMEQPPDCPGCDMLPCMCKYKCKVCGEIMCANEAHQPPEPNEDELADRALEDRYDPYKHHGRYDEPW